MEFSEALEILEVFFEERKKACCSVSIEIAESEQRLYDQFHDFVRAKAHDFQLDMDAGLLMPEIDDWRDIAVVVAGAFKVAMYPQKFGLSNDDPAPRFVAKVIPLMTNQSPSVFNVGKHLKDQARLHQRAKAKPGQMQKSIVPGQTRYQNVPR